MTVLRRYQLEGVAALSRFGGRALLGDDPGLGKSLQALWWTKENNAWPAVVVCPASLKWNWDHEAKKHLGMHTEVLETTRPRKGMLSRSCRLFIINYDILGPWIKFLHEQKPKLVVLDESHYVSPTATQRTRWVNTLCDGIPHLLCLTGTPITNRPLDLWPSLNLLQPKKWPSITAYGHAFCGPKKEYGRWNFRGASNLDVLHRRLVRNCLVRRLKEDVLTELPAKQRCVVPLGVTDLDEYVEAAHRFRKWLGRYYHGGKKGRHRAEALVRAGKLKLLAARLKLPAVLEWVDNFLEGTNEKLLVFAVHHKVLNALRERYPKLSVLVHGGITGRFRQVAFDDFNRKPKLRLFLGQIKAAGVGWNCNSASTTVFAELAWAPGTHTQAEDRCHGLNRGVEGVHSSAHYLIAKGTMEEKLCELLQRKMTIIERVVDGRKDGVTDLNVFDLLMKSLEGEEM